MLGDCRAFHRELDGVDPAAPHSNRDDDGRSYAQAPTTERQMLLDPHHEVEHVAAQLADGNGGFVRDFAESFPASSPEARGFVMGYYPLGFLPALHALARAFTVCDRWFSALPGPTWPNRFFALTGTSEGRYDMPGDGTHALDIAGYFAQSQTTVFDRLTERGVDWKVYFHDIPQSAVLRRQREPHNAARYFYIDEFFSDARGPESEFPQFSLIEPDYMGWGENDDHPPHDVMRAEKLLADVYNALRANEPLWQSVLLVVFYDEHGGFYDHVPPPQATPPDSHTSYPFDRLGVRVPALLISPWVEARVDKTQFDHTSLLKYLIEKWRLAPLGARAASANSIAVALRHGAPRPDMPRPDMPRRDMPRRDTPRWIALEEAQLRPPDPDREEAAFGVPSRHETALRLFAAYLRISVVEGAWPIYVFIARSIEWLAARLLGRAPSASARPLPLRVSIAEPDKVARKGARARDDFARFLRRRKRQALPALASRIRDQSLSDAERDHAVRSLALITGRHFHREHDGRRKASEWLSRHGH